ncbi:cupin domain-containing protein [Mycobacterium sp. 236(2023)]|uniref:cupin domain-containing protein n=1 Tax=Mycobacterium sp. 236(2023) TaxID=3038163 RepID=UPI00241526B8|nr:cupin domain-containing protein [Mycobacterium sp. 236(2023)]MDG4665606.1 cupin domain-containing protein [Mycobacterium sp. 236(2023)]
MHSVRRLLALLIACASLMAPGCAVGNAEPTTAQEVVREILQTTPVEATVPQNAITGLVIFPPGSSAGHHIHHGVESGYVLSGELEIIKDGEPPHTYGPGQTFVTTRDHPHISRNTGPVEARAVVTWIVDAEAPLTTPVPEISGHHQ